MAGYEPLGDTSASFDIPEDVLPVDRGSGNLGTPIMGEGEEFNDPLLGRTESPTWGDLIMNPTKKVPKGSVKSSVFNLISTMLGGGVLSIPYALEKSGLVIGIILLAVTSVASSTSLYMLVDCVKFCPPNQRSFADIAAKAFGRPGRVTTSLSVIILTFFACVAYQVLIRDLLGPVVQEVAGGAYYEPSLYNVTCESSAQLYAHCGGGSGVQKQCGPGWGSGPECETVCTGNAECMFAEYISDGTCKVFKACSSPGNLTSIASAVATSAATAGNLTSTVYKRYGKWFNDGRLHTGAAVLLIFPATFLRDVTSLKCTSLVAMSSIVFLVIVIIIRGSQKIPHKQWHTPPNDVTLFRSGTGLFLSFSIVSVSYLCHFNMLPVRAELKRPTPVRVQRIVRTTMGTAFVLYTLVGVFGYITFGNITMSNILRNNWPPHDILITCGRLALTLTLLMSFPLLTHPCRATIDTLLFKGTPLTTFRLVVETVTMVVLSYCLSIVIPNVTYIWSFMGATVAVMIAFIMPSAFYLKIIKQGFYPKDWEAGKALGLFIFGVFLMVVCTFEAVMNVIEG